jgi:hypothetical protein
MKAESISWFAQGVEMDIDDDNNIIVFNWIAQQWWFLMACYDAFTWVRDSQFRWWEAVMVSWFLKKDLTLFEVETEIQRMYTAFSLR